MTRFLSSALGIAVLATVASAQVLVVPPAAANAEGNSSTSYPWSRGTSALRIQYIYDSSAFTSQGWTGVIPITGLKWRGNGGTSYAGGSYTNVTISVSTAVTDYLTPSTTFANNHGPDLTTVLNQGTVNLLPITSPTTPNQYFVHVQFAAPFYYDPANGDFIVDIQLPAANYSGTGAGVTDYHFGVGTPATRLYNLSDPNATTSTGTNLEAGVVMAFDIANAAQVTPYGAGCYDGYAAFQETFASATFDLAGAPATPNSIRLTYTGTGYAVATGSNAWFTPTSPTLGLGDDAVTPAITLPFTFTHPGGSTNDVVMSSNGFLWLDGTQTSSDLSATAAELATLAPRIAALWMDLNPASTASPGTTHYDVDPAGGAVYVTWLGVVEYGQTVPNDVQIALYANGDAEIRWRAAANISHTTIVGYSPGAVRVPPSTDITGSMPFSTSPDTFALALVPTNRPVLGSTHVIDMRNIPANAVVASVFLGFTQNVPGTDLTSIGMPGCLLHASIDSPFVFLVSAPSQTFSLPIPNSVSLSGLHIYAQAVSGAPAANALTAITSNGLDLLLDMN